MALEGSQTLIDLYPDGKIIIRNPKEKDTCFKEFREMMNCINKMTCNPGNKNKCKKKISAWDKCINN